MSIFKIVGSSTGSRTFVLIGHDYKIKGVMENGRWHKLVIGCSEGSFLAIDEQTLSFLARIDA